MHHVTAAGSLGKPQDPGASAWEQEGQEPDFRTLFESVPGSYLVLNHDLAIVAASNAYLRYTATSRADIVGRRIFDISPYRATHAETAGSADLRTSLERVRRDRVPDTMGVQKYDIKRPDADGGGSEIRYWSQVNSPALDTGGRLAYIIHRVQDVTEYVRFTQHETGHQQPAGKLPVRPDQMEADILARSRNLQDANQALRIENDAQKQFLSRVSHELRSPLNTILGFGELLSFSDITAEHRQWMSMMLRAAHQLLQLLDEVLDISRIEANQLSLSIEAVAVQDVIADALELIRPLALSRGVHLSPPPGPQASQYAAADLERLRQVLLNLLSNAIKYNYPAGKVTVTVDNRPGDRIRISVADTGRGIPEDQLGKLFVPFERLDAAQAGIEGTGLGLALSRQLIQTMGGTTGVASTDGQGSIFWIELPAAEPIAVTQAAIGHDPIVASHTYPAAKTVLYVEDMVENLRLVEQVLRQRPSITLIPAMLAGVALDLARQHHPDLILLDLHLPDMPGQDVMHQLRADPATRDIPIIILSADATQSQVVKLLAGGANDYLTKPIRVRDLLQTFDQILGQPLPGPAQSDPVTAGAIRSQPGISAGAAADRTPGGWSGITGGGTPGIPEGGGRGFAGDGGSGSHDGGGHDSPEGRRAR
jgi:signal transduction histidine kinase/CheY-like chemotaxis protein